MEAWKKSPLFRGMGEAEIEVLLAKEQCRQKTYKKGKFIFLEGDRPRSLFLLISGKVTISQSTMSGKKILLAHITRPGEMFGEVYLFIGKEAYEMDAQVTEEAEILEITGEIPEILWKNMLEIFAKKAYQMNQKVKILGCASIREKIVRYLFERQNTDGTVAGSLIREEMAEYMNVTRPSLSRELGVMQREGIIEIQGRGIRIVNQKEFEKYL